LVWLRHAALQGGYVEAFRYLGSARASRAGDGALAIANFCVP